MCKPPKGDGEGSTKSFVVDDAVSMFRVEHGLDVEGGSRD